MLWVVSARLYLRCRYGLRGISSTPQLTQQLPVHNLKLLLTSQQLNQPVVVPTTISSTMSTTFSAKTHPFIAYSSKLGYPPRLAADAVSRLGSKASTNDLLSTVISESMRSNIRPLQGGGDYLKSQDSYRMKDGTCRGSTFWATKNGD